MPVPIIMPRSMSRMPATPSSSPRQDSMTASCPTRSARASSTWTSVSVLIEALSGLLTEVARLHQLAHALVDVEAVAVRGDHVLGHLQRGVEARHVGQVERPHRREALALDELVDVLDVDARLVLVAPDLGGQRHQDAVDDEAGNLAAADRELLDRLREVGRRLHRLR